jgi:hypothetical protein
VTSSCRGNIVQAQVPQPLPPAPVSSAFSYDKLCPLFFVPPVPIPLFPVSPHLPLPQSANSASSVFCPSSFVSHPLTVTPLPAWYMPFLPLPNAFDYTFPKTQPLPTPFGNSFPAFAPPQRQFDISFQPPSSKGIYPTTDTSSSFYSYSSDFAMPSSSGSRPPMNADRSLYSSVPVRFQHYALSP